MLDDLHRIGIKLFAHDGNGPALREFIPVFHRWIQTAAVEGVLIDVADYSHVPGGPGIVLVAHELHYGIDTGRGRTGLLVMRRQPLEGTLAERFASTIGTTLRAARLLEEAPELECRLRFRTDELQIVSNDRLLAPNTDETFFSLRPTLEAVARTLYGASEYSLDRDPDPRERFGVTIRSKSAPSLAPLLDRLAA